MFTHFVKSVDRSFTDAIVSPLQSERLGYHGRQSFTAELLRGLSGIQVRLAQLLADMQDEHRRQGRKGPIAPRMWVLARDLGCHVSSIVRAYARLKRWGILAIRPRWRQVGKEMLRISSWVTVLFQPERAKARREMAMSEAQLLAQLKERMKEPVLEFTREIALNRQLAKERFKALPPRSLLSKALEGHGLHGPMSSKAATPKISIPNSDMFLSSQLKKPPDGDD